MEKKEHYKSSPGSLEQFLTGSIYKDFQMELDIRIDQLRYVLEDPEAALPHRAHDITRGGIRLLRDMKNVFNDILGNILEDREAEANMKEEERHEK